MLEKRKIPPIHPGEILLEEFLVPFGISQTQFAKHLGWTITRLNEVIKGKRGVTPESALAISQALGTSATVWLNLQRDYDLWHALQKQGRKKIKPILKAS